MLELKDGFVLYHGSYCEVKEPDLAKCAKRKDFGHGFYLTTSKEQADIALQHIERKKCLSKLNVKWRGMISLQERLRMMQQTLPLLLTTIPKEKMNYTIDLLITMVTDEIAEETGKDRKEILTDFLCSKTGKALYDEKTKLWCNGPAYIAELYREELKKSGYQI